jgi:hypothetical protein
MQIPSLKEGQIQFCPIRRGVLDTALCDQIYQWLAVGQECSPDTPVSSTKETDRHDTT